MKFQLKAMAAAVVLAAAVPAQAAIDLGTTGNGSLMLTVFDRAANVSLLVDLGKNYSDFSKIGTSFANSNVDAEGTFFSWDVTFCLEFFSYSLLRFVRNYICFLSIVCL